MGQLFDNRGLQILACVLTALLILVWIIVFVTMVRCLKRRELLWPKNDK
jgi:tellurite resistance protein TehA-like permease